MPSSRIAPKASASAVDQSTPSPLSIILRRRFEETCDRAVSLELLWNLGQLLADFLQRLQRNRCLAAPHFVLAVSSAQTRPCAVQPVGLVRLVGLTDFPLAFEVARQSARIFSNPPA